MFTLTENLQNKPKYAFPPNPKKPVLATRAKRRKHPESMKGAGRPSSILLQFSGGDQQSIRAHEFSG